eukprot:3533948-Amphidinium_carterae.1
MGLCEFDVVQVAQLKRGSKRNSKIDYKKGKVQKQPLCNKYRGVRAARLGQAKVCSGKRWPK